MKMYSPPFSITNEMVSLISEISDKLGRISNYKEFESKPHLRRNNRIKSIHSSLAIEANSLSMDEVRAVVNGKTVIGPQKEIQEVKNAYAAYEQIGSFDPYSVEELKRLHGLLTKYTSMNQAHSAAARKACLTETDAFLWHLRYTSYRSLWMICSGG